MTWETSSSQRCTNSRLIFLFFHWPGSVCLLYPVEAGFRAIMPSLAWPLYCDVYIVSALQICRSYGQMWTYKNLNRILMGLNISYYFNRQLEYICKLSHLNHELEMKAWPTNIFSQHMRTLVCSHCRHVWRRVRIGLSWLNPPWFRTLMYVNGHKQTPQLQTWT